MTIIGHWVNGGWITVDDHHCELPLVGPRTVSIIFNCEVCHRHWQYRSAQSDDVRSEAPFMRAEAAIAELRQVFSEISAGYVPYQREPIYLDQLATHHLDAMEKLIAVTAQACRRGFLMGMVE